MVSKSKVIDEDFGVTLVCFIPQAVMGPLHYTIEYANRFHIVRSRPQSAPYLYLKLLFDLLLKPIQILITSQQREVVPMDR